jgi:hypothetical protein
LRRQDGVGFGYRGVKAAAPQRKLPMPPKEAAMTMGTSGASRL